MNIEAQALITKATNLLKDHPADPVHDLKHHEDVLDNALTIAKNIDEQVDIDLLKIAVMWHDVTLPDVSKSSNNSAEHVKKEMERSGFSENDINEVTDAISSHEYDQTPLNTMGSILYDADKLDILNIDRWQRMYDAEQSGKVSAERAERSLRMIAHWIGEMPSKLHFPISQKIFSDALRKLKQEPLAQKYCDRFSIDLNSL